MNKTLHIPTAFREWHGEFATLSTVVLVNLIAIIGAVSILLFQDVSGFPKWVQVMVALSVFDLAGGLVSQFTASTSAYFETHRLRFIPVFLTQLVHMWAVSLVTSSNDAFYVMTPAFLIGFTLVLVKSEKVKLLLATSSMVILLALVFSSMIELGSIGYLISILFIIKNILATPVFWNKLSN